MAKDETWKLPERGRVGIAGVIIAESAIFLIFMAAFFPIVLATTAAATKKSTA